MSSDRSRSTKDRLYYYDGVVSQQGRVILDRDFNALQQIVNDRAEDEARDVIGPCGTPDNGFEISFAQQSPPGPPLWQPPPPLSPPSGRQSFLDFLIGPGTMYVGGQRAVFASRQAGHTVTYSYLDQPDAIAPLDTIAFPSSGQTFREAVYLDLRETEVGAVEDPDLLDVALGGVDTTQRLRLLRRVRRHAVQSADCAAARAELVAAWRQNGRTFDPQTMRLVPDTTLRVSFTQGQVVTNLCDPIATGGYLGADNQLIRVQIADAGDATHPAQLVWGYDDASFMYRVGAIAANGGKLQLVQDPPDTFHIPQAGQVIEILRTAAVLASEPDETDPAHQRTIVRCIAEPTGVLRSLTQPYGSAAAGEPKYLALDTPLPAEYLNDTNPLFVRVWQANLSFNRAGAAVTLTDQVGQTSTGIVVTIAVPSGETPAVGAYWLIGVRPSTPQAVYPEALLTEPQPPDGPREWVCPLAVIDWTGQAIHDCRNKFESLVALTRRKPGCCMVSVRPEDITPSDTLQAIIDRAAGTASEVAVCLGEGIYLLNKPLILDARHSHMTLEGCGGFASIQPNPKADPAAFGQGVIVLAGATGVTLRGLRLDPPHAPLSVGLRNDFKAMTPSILKFAQNNPRAPQQIQFMDSMVATMAAMIGIRAVDSPNLTIDGCTVVFDLRRQINTLAVRAFGAGVFAGADCTGLTVTRCKFEANATPTAVPGISYPVQRLVVNLPGDRAAPPVAIATAPPPTARLGDTATAAAPSLASTPAAGSLAGAPATAASLGSPPRLADEPEILRLLTPTAATVTTPVGVDVGTVLAIEDQDFLVVLGCLVCPTVPDFLAPSDNLTYGFKVPSVLDAAVISDNRFDRLTLALLSVAETGTVRISDNMVRGCVGGFWLMPVRQERFSFNRG
jgi:hypothetical protein